ncbi:hypothetical protein PIB30_089371 [Stylosanthes scabra]|uniref:Uncharacterized protein n=1 Tax=Stylosanthes scabra TaxID=79078 RepID=A0ABU6QWE1_9FABA|nr:hypothetical protein [Stylosanthes scabra]
MDPIQPSNHDRDSASLIAYLCEIVTQFGILHGCSVSSFSPTVQADRPIVANDLIRQKGVPFAKEKLHCWICKHTDRDLFCPMGFRRSTFGVAPSTFVFEIGGMGAGGNLSRVVTVINTPLDGEMETHFRRVVIEECCWKSKI